MGLKKSSKISAEFNMSSLTDIIFLLLIFFMLTSTLVSPNAINLKLPSSSRTKAASTRQPITISISKEKQYRFNGLNASFAELTPKLNAAVKSDGRNSHEVTVILQVDSEVDVQTLVDVVEIITNAGTKMVLATQGIAPTQ